MSFGLVVDLKSRGGAVPASRVYRTRVRPKALCLAQLCFALSVSTLFELFHLVATCGWWCRGRFVVRRLLRRARCIFGTFANQGGTRILGPRICANLKCQQYKNAS